MPALHQPTFDVMSISEPLLQAVACIGAAYRSIEPDYAISRAFFEAGYKALYSYV